ncbi:MAG: ATP-binding cassette domain-containing protein [Bacteroidales bacterium]|jgi:phospholipid/cholesterol/gamma-HCH transport system ATP-binding protein|nr:ATP-binding cassette domain-containing protein [Bacteroidales bacterium]
MIETKHINKSFEDKQVLFDINIVFEDSVNNIIIGQSGSGKTVLMRCLLGLFSPDSGDILFDGRNFVGASNSMVYEVRKDIGTIFQNSALFDSMNVLQNVMFPLDMFSTMSYADKVERSIECLQQVGLENVEYKMPSELSGGMRKRVAIARAISTRPKYLFCDEPNSGLDPYTSSLIDDLINELTLKYNITTVINTHDMNSVLKMGDRINFVYQGHIAWQGTSKDILCSNSKELVEFLESSELTKRLLCRN